jgi:hypothetical protein
MMFLDVMHTTRARSQNTRDFANDSDRRKLLAVLAQHEQITNCSTGSLKIKNKFVIKIETRRVRRSV